MTSTATIPCHGGHEHAIVRTDGPSRTQVRLHLWSAGDEQAVQAHLEPWPFVETLARRAPESFETDRDRIDVGIAALVQGF